MTDALPHGAYDQVLIDELIARLRGLQVSRLRVEDAESADTLGQHIGRLASRHLAALAPELRVDEANRLLETMGGDNPVAPGPEQLLAVAEREAPGVWRLLQIRPQVPLSRPALLTNSSNDPGSRCSCTGASGTVVPLTSTRRRRTPSGGGSSSSRCSAGVLSCSSRRRAGGRSWCGSTRTCGSSRSGCSRWTAVAARTWG